jgi:nitrite reductase/ring-hydroxylating ferredoxin subunit
MAGFTKVAVRSDIQVGSMKSFEVNHTRIVLVHSEEGFFALADECTHDSAPISDGQVRGEHIICTRHGARFAAKTGKVEAPPAIVPLDTFQVKLEGDNIYVLVDD